MQTPNTLTNQGMIPLGNNMNLGISPNRTTQRAQNFNPQSISNVGLNTSFGNNPNLGINPINTSQRQQGFAPSSLSMPQTMNNQQTNQQLNKPIVPPAAPTNSLYAIPGETLDQYEARVTPKNTTQPTQPTQPMQP